MQARARERGKAGEKEIAVEGGDDVKRAAAGTKAKKIETKRKTGDQA
jgi:hypothetical protein